MKTARKPSRKLGSLMFLAIFYFTGLFISSCTESVNIEQSFIKPPDSAQMSIYWYWVSDNISREGVIEDLKAMKRVGINRAIIANVGHEVMYTIPFGNVKLFTDEWWDITHTALKTAGELGIEIGFYNCPGWSSSGGPWIKPEQSMRYLANSEVFVKGPEKINSKLPVPGEDFEDVKLLAFRIPKDFGRKITEENARITSVPYIQAINHIADGKMDTEVSLPSEKPLIIDFEINDPVTIRSILFHVAEKPVLAKGEIFVKDKTGFRSIKNFVINRSDPKSNLGFKPYGAISVSISAATGRVFRLVISEATPGSGLKEIELSVSPFTESYMEKSLAKMYQGFQPSWDDYRWAPQPEVDEAETVINPSEVIDISEFMSTDGTLTWEVPDGEWMIMRTGMLPTGITNQEVSPQGKGLEVDKLNKEHVQYHFDSFMGEIIRRIPAEDRKTLTFAVVESYEVGSQNWTDDFIQIFKERYEYDLVPFIPVLNGYVVSSRDFSDRFLWDLRRLIADRFSYEYIGELRNICNKNGLSLWAQNYGHWGYPGEFLQYGGQMDEISGEFWNERALGDIECRAAASAAHIYGKNKVSAESFTDIATPHFSMYPAKMKRSGDKAFAEGINDTYLVVNIQQAYNDRKPGVNSLYGSEFNRHNIWFDELGMFIDYLKRANFILQQGKYVADVAYFIGEDAPVMNGVRDPELPRGYSFDYINAEVIQTRLSVKNNKLVLPDGMSYNILVLPKLETMRPELLRKIKELVNQGAVVLGPPPQRSPSLENYPHADEEVQSLANELWNGVDEVNTRYKNFGEGMVLSGMNMQEAFGLLHIVPDCKLAPEDPVLFIHRTLPDMDIYFLTNQSNQTIDIYPEFRVKGKAPELWEPINGTIRDLPVYIIKEKSTVVPLKMEPLESAFIVFRKKAGKVMSNELKVNFPDPSVILELKGPWEVVFNPEQRGPAQPVSFEELTDWSKRPEDSIKYYSGKAVYHNTFEMKKVTEKTKIILDLGNVIAMAKVRINGENAGGTWAVPWHVDISNLVKSGENSLEIEVVNTWTNRLIGDSLLPENERKTWATFNWFLSGYAPIQPAGLLGPVQIQIFDNNVNK